MAVEFLRVLHVDDNDGDAALVRRIVKDASLSWTLVRARNGLEGCRAIPAGHFNCIITDFNMPAMDGLQMLRQIQSDTRGIPKILMSGSLCADTAQRARALGATLCVTKSLDLEQLEANLRTIDALAREHLAFH